MAVAYFDCFCGAAGDMILGALLDAGCPVDSLRDLVARLALPGVSVAAETTQRHGLAATQARVVVEPGSQTAHRHLPDIERIITQARLSPRVTERALAVFRRLAEAEARVHGTPVDHVHFHEVGAADAIVDIVGACVALEVLDIERVECSPIPAGAGTVTCEHGVMPVPAPATAQLLRGVAIADCPEPGELTTPTGAAILTTLAERFGPPPAMTLAAVGVGAGSRQGRTRPNILRVLIGAQDTPADGQSQDTVTLLETQVDDATGQVLGHAAETLLAAGALDVFIVPIIMKKGRPGQLVTVVCRPGDADALADRLFAETGTLGVRLSTVARLKLARESQPVETPFGTVRVKIGRRGERVVRAWPEYEDCAAAARKAGVALHEVQQEALRNWRQTTDDPEHSHGQR